MNESQEVFDTNAEIKVELPDKTPAMTSENSVADDISTADAAAVVTQENDPESQMFQNSSEIDIRSVSSHTGSENSEENLTEELQQGLRILRELMSDSNKSVNWHFLWPVDDSMPDTANYYEKIQKPMWFNKMKDKFESGEYETITQFVADFRLMLENCYRYNGPDHFVSKRAQKLETMMEQKLTLLSRELREKTSIAATSGDQTDENFGVASLGSRRRTRAIVPHDSTALLNQLREQEVQREREIRKQQMVWRKKQQEDYHQQMIDWEDKIMEGKGQEMKAMWELPQMGLFLFLCQIPLNIGEVSQFELERCFYMPRESSALQRVMTALLSTPFQRTKIGKKWMMPYKVWEEKLRVKSRIWYQMYHNSGRNTAKVAEKFGLDPMFFSVLGHKNPLEKHKFHEISVYKRIWLVKSLCDYCLETQESLQNTLEGQPEEELRDYRLGVDAEGNTYLHFPQFCGADLRIYRQAYIPEPKWESVKPVPSSPKRKSSIDSEDEEQETPMRSKKVKKSSSSQKKKKRKQKQEEDAQFIPFSRPSHLRQTIKTVLPVPVFEESESSSSDSECSENDTVSQSDSTMNESSICDNTPDSRTKVNNKSLLRLQESDNFSDTSSVDCDYFIGRRLRSNRILRFEDESSRDSEQLSRSRRLTTRKSRTSVRTEMDGTITPDRGSDVGDSELGNNERTGQDSISKGRGRGQLGSVSSDNGTDISATPFDEENSNDTDSVRVSMFKKKLREERDGYSSDETMEGGDPQNIDDMEDVELEDGDGKKKEENDSCDLIENNSISDFSENSQSNCESQKDVNSVMDEKGDGVTKQTFQDCDNRRSEHLSSQHLFNGDDLHVCREIHKDVSSAEETVHNDINESDLNSGKGDYLFDSGANINGEKEECVRTQSDKCLENDSYNSKQIQEAPSNECIKNDLMNTEVKDEEKGESVRTYRMNSEVFDVNGDSKSDSSESDMSELSRDTKQDCELSRETKQDCELSTETKQDCELSKETKQDCELSTETKQDCELSRETKQDCELSRETKQDCDIQNIPENCTGMIEEIAMSNEGYAGASIEDFKTGDEHTLIKEDEASITCEDSKVKTEKEDSICESGEESKVDIKKENEEDAQGIKTECEEKVYEDSTLTNGNIDEHDEEMNDDMKIEMKMDVDNKEGGVIKEEEGDDGKENVKKEDNTEEEKYNLTDENKANKTEDVKEEPQEDSEDEEEGLIMGPEIGPFELIVEGVEELRKLAEQFAPPDPEASPTKSKKQKMMKPPPRKRCVVALHERLLYLLKELEPWEHKLCQAAKRARIKMKKEQESWKEAEEAGWESDKSERSCSDTEDADTDIENVGVEGDKNETRTPSNSQNSQEDGASIDPFLNEDGILDVSSRGRIRKRRIIPNNVEDTAKKRKTVTTLATPTTLTEPVDTKSSTVKPGQILATAGPTNQILLHSSDGKKTLVTGLTPQQLSSLRFLKSGPTLIQTSTLHGRAPGAVLTTSPQLLTSKQASHPVMQQLLSTRQSGAKVTYAQGEGVTGNTGKDTTPSALSNLNPSLIRPAAAPGKSTQYYAAKVNSLPPQVLQQLLKSNAAKLLPGSTPTSGMVLLSAVVPPTSSSMAGQTVMLNLTGTQGVQAAPTNVQKTNQTVIFPNQPRGAAPRIIIPQSQNLAITQAQLAVPSSAMRPQTVVYQTPLQTTQVSPSAAAAGQRIILSPSQVGNVGRAIGPMDSNNSSAHKIVLAPAGAPLNAADLQRLVLQQTQLKPTQEVQPVKGSGIAPVSGTLQCELESSEDKVGKILCVTTDESEKNLKIVSDLANSSTSNAVKTIPTPQIIRMSPNKLSNTQKYASNVTVKALLETRRERDDGGAPVSKAISIETVTQSSQTLPVTSSCLLLNSDMNFDLPVSSSTTGDAQIPAANKSTLIIQSTASGIKTLKIPSKAALDSAVQAVVTEVKTSLPTAHIIKVPSPTTMPSIQPRKNVTKTIQSMKMPIPTAPTVESKIPKSNTHGSHAIAIVGQSNSGVKGISQVVKTPTSSNQFIIKPATTIGTKGSSGNVSNQVLENVDQRNMMLKVVPNVQGQGQGVIQGYLTPQGIIIPQGGVQQQQQQQKGVQKQILMSPQTLTSHGVVIPASQFQQGFVSQPTAILQKGVAGSASSVSQTAVKPLSIDATSHASVLLSSKQTPTRPSGQKILSLPLSVASNVRNQSVSSAIGSSKKQGHNKKTSDIVTTQISSINCPKSTLTSSVLASSVQSTQNVVQSLNALQKANSTQQGIILQKAALQSHSTSQPHRIVPQIAQSPVQLTSPVIGQVNSSTALLGQLKSPVSGQQIMGYVGNTQIIPQSTLQYLNTPQGLARIIQPNQIPSSSVIQTSTTQSNQQTKTSFGILNAAGQLQVQSSVQPGVVLGNVPLSLNQQQGQINPIKPGQAIIGHGSSSELMKQIAAVQQLNLGQQGNVIIPHVNQQNLSQNVSSLQSGNINPVLLQLPNIQGQNQAKVPGQGQTMLLLSPKQSNSGQSQKLVTPNKQLHIHQKTPNSNIVSPVASRSNSTIRELRTPEPSPSASTKVPLHFNFSNKAPEQLKIKPAVPVQARRNSATQNQSNASKTNTSINLKPRSEGDLAGQETRKDIVGETKSQDKLASQAIDPNQKLFLYNIGGQLVTPQGVPVTVDNGVLKVLPKGHSVIPQETLNMMQKSAQLQGLTSSKSEGNSVKIKFDVSQKSFVVSSTCSTDNSVIQQQSTVPSAAAISQPQNILKLNTQTTQIGISPHLSLPLPKPVQNLSSNNTRDSQYALVTSTVMASISTATVSSPSVIGTIPNCQNSLTAVKSLPVTTSSITLHFQNPTDFKAGSHFIQQLPTTQTSKKKVVGPGYFVVRSQRPGLYSYIDSAGFVVAKPMNEGESSSPQEVVPVTLFSNVSMPAMTTDSGTKGINKNTNIKDEKMGDSKVNSNYVNGGIIVMNPASDLQTSNSVSALQVSLTTSIPNSQKKDTSNSDVVTQIVKKENCESEQEAALNLLSLANQSFNG